MPQSANDARKHPTRPFVAAFSAHEMKHLSGLLLQNGKRKYLNADERGRFLAAADAHEPDVRTFCGVLAFAGCRLSEALELTADRVDLANGAIVFESLKKRRRGIFRAVPVPPALLDTLNLVHGVRKLQARRDGGKEWYLWAWSRTTAWRRVCEVMDEAKLSGIHASPKGLRHGVGVAAVQCGIPLNLLQRWLGHAHLSTTAIYADAVGPEEHMIASRMWATR